MDYDNQKPTQSYILPYEVTKGQEAADLYNSTGRTALEWQELILNDILAVNDESLWTHTRFGYSLPRRNGKNEVIAARELWGLVNGEHILHTAHRTTTTHSAWERLLDLVELSDMEVKSSYRAFGKEHIEIKNGGKIEFRTRTSKGGLGEGFDLLVIDEAQEYQEDQESALKYTVTSSRNPQTIMTGTPPTPLSSGTVFVNFRNSVLAGATANSAWAEWSVDEMTDVHDKDAWYKTNPSLGKVFTERSVNDEISGDEADFNIQRLGLWMQHNLKSAISATEWNALRVDVRPKCEKDLYVGIKYGHDGLNVAMSIAVKTKDDRIFVETYACRSVRDGNDWILAFLKKAQNVRRVVIDGASRQSIIAGEMKREKLKAPVFPKTAEVVSAYANFEQAIFRKTICHCGQESLAESVSNCEKRAIGTGGGFGYRSIKEGVDISLLDSVAFAHWAAVEDKGHVTQAISY